MFNTQQNPHNDVYLMFIHPERFRYNFLVDFIHTNRLHFFKVISQEEQKAFNQNKTPGRSSERQSARMAFD
jgi:hypothetical protein